MGTLIYDIPGDRTAVNSLLVALANEPEDKDFEFPGLLDLLERAAVNGSEISANGPRQWTNVLFNWHCFRSRNLDSREDSVSGIEAMRVFAGFAVRALEEHGSDDALQPKLDTLSALFGIPRLHPRQVISDWLRICLRSETDERVARYFYQYRMVNLTSRFAGEDPVEADVRDTLFDERGALRRIFSARRNDPRHYWPARMHRWFLRRSNLTAAFRLRAYLSGWIWLCLPRLFAAILGGYIGLVGMDEIGRNTTANLASNLRGLAHFSGAVNGFLPAILPWLFIAVFCTMAMAVDINRYYRPNSWWLLARRIVTVLFLGACQAGTAVFFGWLVYLEPQLLLLESGVRAAAALALGLLLTLIWQEERITDPL